MYEEVSRVLVTLGSAGLTAGLYSQALKTWRTKSVRDLSGMIVLAVIVNELLWLNYGNSIQEWPILLVSGLNLPAAIAIGVGYHIYRRKE